MLAIVIAASGALNLPCTELKNIELERATITSSVGMLRMSKRLAVAGFASTSSFATRT